MNRLAVLGLLGSAAAAGTYTLDVQYSGDTFLDGFDFEVGADIAGGYVNYVDRTTAEDNVLVTVDTDGANLLGFDIFTTLDPNGQGRDAVKITSKRSFTHGLIISDLNNMPGGQCGVEAGHYTIGPDWPNSGEIDIIQGTNDATADLTSLFTAPTCSSNDGGAQLGTPLTTQCDDPNGCTTLNPDSFSYGVDFNDNAGGVYATQWDSDFIKVWFFARDMIPADITAGTPDPTLPEWGLPIFSSQGSCNVDGLFMDNKIVFDTNFCTSAVEAQWTGSTCESNIGLTCREYLATFPDILPDDFSNFYWGINSVTVYSIAPDSVSSAVPSAAASTAAAVSSSIAAASSTVAAASSTIPAAVSSAVASASAIPSDISIALPGYNYLGCADDTPLTLLDGSRTDDPAMTLEMCSVMCAGSKYMGVEDGITCVCGNILNPDPAPLVAQSECNIPCPGDASEICGGNMSRLPKRALVQRAPGDEVRLSLFVVLAVSPSSAIPSAAASSAAVSSGAASSIAAVSSGAASSFAAVSSGAASSIAAVSSGAASSFAAVSSGAASSIAAFSSGSSPSFVAVSSIISASSSSDGAMASNNPAAGSTSIPSTLVSITSGAFRSSFQVTASASAIGSGSARLTTAGSTTTTCTTTPRSTTSTVYATLTYTVTSCAPTVTNCPMGQLTTETRSMYTTVCPYNPMTTGYQVAPHGTAPPMYTTVVVTTYVDVCPLGLTTYTTSQTQVHFSGYTSAHIPMVTTTKCAAMEGGDSACYTVTLPYTVAPPTYTPTAKGNVASLAANRSDVKTSTIMVYPIYTGQPSSNATKAGPTATAVPYPTATMTFSAGQKTMMSWAGVLACGLMAVLLL